MIVICVAISNVEVQRCLVDADNLKEKAKTNMNDASFLSIGKLIAGNRDAHDRPGKHVS